MRGLALSNDMDVILWRSCNIILLKSGISFEYFLHLVVGGYECDLDIFQKVR